ncbi:hypothetical protein F5B22DRAFT_288965 [Xylaria bambusicola]|uniref:uncharacterized protein n=1 Tax=Xylaria bambusicola TaxID=326684 RepID=UPI00200846AF|nr:uncharacterized protein F5B22DRAFT_288965 [Xylaria bambusicola]KAI0512906.1 hypothetical protein F5B22DRAFT_288965 [Xylaria bambusicola]
MSGSGGFYKYRCKYFLTHECPNWVYVNNTACAECSAQGREADSEASQAPVVYYSQERCVPRVEDGVLYYTRTEIPVEVENVQTATTNNYWYGANNQAQARIPTTNAIPGSATAATNY